MRSLFLSPHPDDAILFGCFTLLAERPDVVTVLWPDWQERNGVGIPATVRVAEDAAAMEVLGLAQHHDQWPYSEHDPPWEEIGKRLGREATRREYDGAELPYYDRVYAPAVEHGGHRHHNNVGELALAAFGPRTRRYLTYTPEGKSRVTIVDGGFGSALEVFPPRPEAITLKLRALACYRSQIETPAAQCAAHFMRDLTEWQIP